MQTRPFRTFYFPSKREPRMSNLQQPTINVDNGDHGDHSTIAQTALDIASDIVVDITDYETQLQRDLADKGESWIAKDKYDISPQGTAIHKSTTYSIL